MSERQATIEFLKSELDTLFPGRGVRVFERNILGETNIHVVYTHHADKSKCVSGILENDRAFMHFTIWNERDGTFYVDYPTCHMGRVFDDKTVKFRKIKGKTERETAEKLLAWFKKHQAHILFVGAQA